MRGGPAGFRAGLLIAALASGLPGRIAADALASLPARWEARLQPVAEADVSGVERKVREAIARSRERIAAGLRESVAEAQLAGEYGELAALYQLVDIDSAAAAGWRNALTLDPGTFRWWYYAAYHALESGHTEKALRYFEQARQRDSDYPPLDLRLGQLWLETSRLERAEAALRRAAQAPGLRAAALYHLGQLALIRRDYEQAVSHLREVLELQPEASAAHYPLAQAYRHLGRSEQARAHLERFQRHPPSVEDPLIAELEGVLETSRGLFAQAMQAIDERDYAQAAEHFRAGLEIDPDNLAARTSYARVLFLEGSRAAAKAALEQILEQDPDRVLANFLYGVALQAQGKTEAAIERYRRVIALDPQLAGAHFYLANALFRAGQHARAAERYRAALEADADIPPARLLELVARQRAGAPEERLLRELEARIELYPAQTELQYALVRLLSLARDTSLHDRDRALALAEDLVDRQASPPHLAGLALANAAAGSHDKAVRLQRQVIDMLGWVAAPALREQLEAALQAYRDAELPDEPVWPATDPLFTPPALDPWVVFRNYPAPVPY